MDVPKFRVFGWVPFFNGTVTCMMIMIAGVGSFITLGNYLAYLESPLVYFASPNPLSIHDIFIAAVALVAAIYLATISWRVKCVGYDTLLVRDTGELVGMYPLGAAFWQSDSRLVNSLEMPYGINEHESIFMPLELLHGPRRIFGATFRVNFSGEHGSKIARYLWAVRQEPGIKPGEMNRVFLNLLYQRFENCFNEISMTSETQRQRMNDAVEQICLESETTSLGIIVSIHFTESEPVQTRCGRIVLPI